MIRANVYIQIRFQDDPRRHVVTSMMILASMYYRNGRFYGTQRRSISNIVWHHHIYIF